MSYIVEFSQSNLEINVLGLILTNVLRFLERTFQIKVQKAPIKVQQNVVE